MKARQNQQLIGRQRSPSLYSPGPSVGDELVRLPLANHAGPVLLVPHARPKVQWEGTMNKLPVPARVSRGGHRCCLCCLA